MSTKVVPKKKKKSSAVLPVAESNSNNSNNPSNPPPTTTTNQIDDIAARVGASIEDIFGRYDVDNNGNIDAVELEALLNDVNHMAGDKASANLEQEVQEVLKAIGTTKEDGIMSIEKEAFIEWTLSRLIKGYGGGISKSIKDPKKPARKMSRALPHQLERFLSSMGKVSLQIAAASSTTPRLYRDFRRYLPHELSAKPNNNVKLVNKAGPIRPKSAGLPNTKAGTSSAASAPSASPTPSSTASQPITPAMSIHQVEARGTVKVACALLHLQLGLRILFEQFGHHDKTIDAGMTMNDVGDVFRKLPIYYEKVKSALNSKEATELELSLPNICTVADAAKVFRALDANGNGKIEMREFSDWFVAGSIRTPQQQVRTEAVVVCACAIFF